MAAPREVSLQLLRARSTAPEEPFHLYNSETLGKAFFPPWILTLGHLPSATLYMINEVSSTLIGSLKILLMRSSNENSMIEPGS